jgi:SagB-type dehydrogenase family enzyme
MQKNKILSAIVFASYMLSLSTVSTAARKEIKLAKPSLQGGIPLMTALSSRQSSRSFSARALPDRVLSNLLWAADGINRPDAGKRTAPSAMNKQEIAIYVAMEEGLYVYDAPKHALELVVAKDIRSLTGRQAFVKSAALNIVYVADMRRVAGGDREEKLLYAGADTGFIGQNVYLYCASEGLSTVIRGYIDKEALGKAMGLRPEQMIVLSQTVGYPGN